MADAVLARAIKRMGQGLVSRLPAPYRIFDVTLARKISLSPSLTRFVFTGADVAYMRTQAPDQRIKVIFPSADGRDPALPRRGDWHAAQLALPLEQRPPMRTYTIRSLRRAAKEIDVDFVLHGATGPASRWALQAQAGARIQLVAPSRFFPGNPYGYEWRPPAGIERVLLLGDETALPAIGGILDELLKKPSPPSIEAFIEIPTQQDQLDLPAAPSLRVHWLPRDRLAMKHGEAMIHAARKLAAIPADVTLSTQQVLLSDIDIDHDILWDQATGNGRAFYAWIAGESAAVMAIRRHFIKEKQCDRRAFSFMGYWRLGKVLG